jgi:hypothetical protein
MPEVYEGSHSEIMYYSTQQQTANLRALQIIHRPFHAFQFMEGTSGYVGSYPANDTSHAGNIHGINYSLYCKLKLLSGT